MGKTTAIEKPMTLTTLIELEPHWKRAADAISADIGDVVRKSKATILKVENLTESAVADGKRKELGGLAKSLNQKRLEVGRIINSYKTSWDERYNALAKPAAAEAERLKQMILDHKKAEDAKQAEAEAARQAEIAKREAMQRAHEEKGHQIDPTPRELLVPEVPDARTKVAATVRKVWKWDRVDYDFDKVPREYLTLDVAKITAAVKAGTREIPGITIYPEDVL